jgi:RNA polymerase sigma-70 factor (ECF subfamily)
LPARTSHPSEAGIASVPADGELLARAREDPDEARRGRAASMLLERYQDRVYLWCLRMVREHEQALDLAQDVLLNAYRNLASFEGRSEFGSWLFMIARNRCLDSLRRPPVFRDETEVEELVDPSSGPAEQLEEKLDEAAFLELIRERLDPVEQEVLWLRCMERVPVEEITRLLRLESASGARGVLQRARRKLRAAAGDSRTCGGYGS